MSQLQTPVKIPSPGFAINYLDSLFLLGSCFAENIGLKLYEHKFNCQVNPFGVLYNPASIAQSIQSLMHRTEYTKDDLLKHNNIWLSFDHYTLFSKPDEKECLEGINKSFNLAKNKLKQAKTLILTFGTSAVYRFKKTGRIVSNCHKIPANEFERSFLSSDEIVDTLLPVLDKLLNTSPELKIIVTISPIRHWKDGAIENMRSKASLILAIKQLEQKLSKLYYFPV
ncbi:MAG: GSCFA domain-containing protein, partial [Bacteroidales bacterium]|nr:GSCFA domain-containing protein [Bacteroidales bacterium]